MTRTTRPTHGHPGATRRPRSGVVLVEFAISMTFILVPLLYGIWEVGRAVQVQQIIATASREGARLASQGRTTTGTGAQTDIRTALTPGTPGSNQPNVKAAVMQSLAGAGLSGLTWADVTVTFTFLDGNTGNTDPYQGTKNQLFKVDVSIAYGAKVRWVDSGLPAYVGISTLRSSTQWRMLMDDPFAVNPNMPTW